MLNHVSSTASLLQALSGNKREIITSFRLGMGKVELWVSRKVYVK